ncbi:MAG TPA: MarR family transcriptional regulator [Acidimicrobiales bacterium]|nr:MarR family transcriptional regulator [Acidimicrobiales bacterium]
MTDRSRSILEERESGRAAAARPQEHAGEAPQDDDLPGRLRIAVTRLNRRLRQESVTGISPSQESALSTINRLGQPTLGELAQAEQVQPPTMTRVIVVMEEAGLVAKRGDEGDRRVIRVQLTAEGRATLQRIKNLKNAYLARQIEMLTPADRAQAGALASLLERLVAER